MKASHYPEAARNATLFTGKGTGIQAPPRLIPVSNSATASRCGPLREVLACEESSHHSAQIAKVRVARMEATGHIIVPAESGSDMLLRLGHWRSVFARR
jgi:hypothetical protein